MACGNELRSIYHPSPAWLWACRSVWFQGRCVPPIREINTCIKRTRLCVLGTWVVQTVMCIGSSLCDIDRTLKDNARLPPPLSLFQTNTHILSYTLFNTYTFSHALFLFLSQTHTHNCRPEMHRQAIFCSKNYNPLLCGTIRKKERQLFISLPLSARRSTPCFLGYYIFILDWRSPLSLLA